MTLDTTQLIALFLLVVDIELLITLVINPSFALSFKNLIISFSLAFTVVFVAYFLFGTGMHDFISIFPVNKTQLMNSALVRNCSLFNNAF